MESLQIVQTAAALGAITMILIGIDWLKQLLLGRVR